MDTTETPTNTSSGYNHAKFRSFTPTIHHDVYPFISRTGVLRNSQAHKTVLVTGAGRGIGRACAEAFAGAAGAGCVILVARSAGELEETKGVVLAGVEKECLVLTIAADLSKEEEVERLWKGLRESGVVPDVLFNNAGRMEDPGRFDSVAVGDWWGTFVSSLLLFLVWWVIPRYPSQ